MKKRTHFAISSAAITRITKLTQFPGPAHGAEQPQHVVPDELASTGSARERSGYSIVEERRCTSFARSVLICAIGLSAYVITDGFQRNAREIR